jgi:hypothetical protein
MQLVNHKLYLICNTASASACSEITQQMFTATILRYKEKPLFLLFDALICHKYTEFTGKL